MKKRVLSVVLVVLIIMFSTIPVSAANRTQKSLQPIETIKNTLQPAAYIDFSNPISQEVVYKMPSGETAVIGAEYIGGGIQPKANYQLKNGNWRIYWYIGVLNIQYYITTKNGSITNA